MLKETRIKFNKENERHFIKQLHAIKFQHNHTNWIKKSFL
jgi:hypothetical protein